MNKKKAQATLEAILFAMGESVDISRLAEVIETDVETCRSYLEEMTARYKRNGGGIMMAWYDNSVQLCTKPEFYDDLVKIAKAPKRYTLSDSCIETLSIVAYKQPVTRSMIEQIRGVNCDHAVNRLLELDLICELGRMDAPGKPILFGTTEQFLKSFGVKNVDELPHPDALVMEEFKQQAEEEVKLSLDV
jgi:segregation and condensation protein B